MPRKHSSALTDLRLAASSENGAGGQNEKPLNKNQTKKIIRAGWTPGRLAEELGLSQSLIVKRCREGLLPTINHGTSTRARYYIPPDVVRIAKTRGLATVARMHQAGMI